MPHREPLNIKRPLVAARSFIFAGESYSKGDKFPHSGDASTFSLRLLKRQYEARVINHADAAAGDAGEDASTEQLVTMTGPSGGRYTINAPWLEEPETVRGKVNAENRLKEITAEGAPVGWIEGGSAVTVEGGEGGWFTIDAPWLEEAEKVQGRDAAETRQRELHAAGEPDTYAGVTLTAGDNGYYSVKADWLDEAETVHGAEAARTRAAELREEGAPAATDGEQGGEGDAGAGAGAEGAGAAADGGTAATETTDETKTDASDPHKGEAEKVAGTGPAQAADDVAAAAGDAPKE